MRKKSGIALVSAFAFFMHNATADGAPVSASEANSLVQAYATALQGGDTAALQNLLGGNLLTKRMRLWSNPEYPSMLAATYAESTFQVSSVDTEQNGGNALVRLVLNEAGSKVEKVLILARLGSSVRIIDERVATDQ